MIRWYDYIAVLLFSDAFTTWIFSADIIMFIFTLFVWINYEEIRKPQHNRE